MLAIVDRHPLAYRISDPSMADPLTYHAPQSRRPLSAPIIAAGALRRVERCKHACREIALRALECARHRRPHFRRWLSGSPGQNNLSIK